VERRSYDVLAEGVVVDRIMKAAAALNGSGNGRGIKSPRGREGV
jgi:hypothetical protein